MKLSYIVVPLLLSSCVGSGKPISEKEQAAAVVKADTAEVGKPKPYTTQDSVFITAGNTDTLLAYSREEFNAMVDEHPELYDEWTSDPDDTYLLHGSGFGSEAGQDQYFVLYAYFLKQRNGEACAQCRQQLIDIFTNISYLFSQFQRGGTYFGHQTYRIMGYAEYAVCSCPHNKDMLKPYDIAKQKSLYIQSLRQLIRDEISIKSMQLEEQERKEWLNSMNKAVDNIDKNITDIFYLRQAQEFQYHYYNYYD